MAIKAISGKPGGGKSMFATKLIIEELVHGSRCVVTNLPLRLPELNAYLQEKYPEKTINLFERVFMLDDDQAGQFWLHRGPESSGVFVLEKETGKMTYTVSGKPAGVMFVIDEIHNYFNAREWMKTGKGALYYLSQHRKLGDDVIWVTQSIGNVDKQFRSMTQDYTYIRNLGKERFGFFRSFPLFLRQTYLDPATATSSPMMTTTFTLDVKGIASCYDTAAGVGIKGFGADIGERKKGLSPVYMILGVVAIAVGIMFVPKLIGKVVGSLTKVNGSRPVAVDQVGGKKVDPLPAREKISEPQKVEVKSLTSNQAGSMLATTGADTNKPVVITSLVVFGLGKARIGLSDGRVITERDPKLTHLAANYIVYDGKRIENGIPGKQEVKPDAKAWFR